MSLLRNLLTCSVSSHGLMGKILVLCKGFVADLKVLVLVEVLLVIRIFLITVISQFQGK